MNDCIFCKIINKEIPKDFIFSSDTIVAFDDINPSADVHILIVPKIHISGIKDLTENHASLLAEIYQVVNKLVSQYNLSDKLYRVVINGGLAQGIPHIHFHLLGGKIKKMV